MGFGWREWIVFAVAAGVPIAVVGAAQAPRPDPLQVPKGPVQGPLGTQRPSVLVAPGQLSAAAGPTAVAAGCEAAMSATGTSKFGQGFAAENARSHWQNEAAGAHGADYGLWDNAANRVIGCTRATGTMGKWTCTLTAEPCFPGGTSTTNTGLPACQPSVSATGGQALLQQPGAEANARNQWQHDVGIAYGGLYNDWTKAQGPSMNCRHNGRIIPNRRWQCTATGTPCR